MNVIPETISEVRAFSQAILNTFERLSVDASPVKTPVVVDPGTLSSSMSFGVYPDTPHVPKIRITASFRQLAVNLIEVRFF